MLYVCYVYKKDHHFVINAHFRFFSSSFENQNRNIQSWQNHDYTNAIYRYICKRKSCQLNLKIQLHTDF